MIVYSAELNLKSKTSNHVNLVYLSPVAGIWMINWVIRYKRVVKVGQPVLQPKVNFNQDYGGYSESHQHDGYTKG